MANDRIAMIADRLRAKVKAAMDLDDDEANLLVDELTLDERRELMALVRQKLARGEEVLEAELEELAAMQAMIDVRKQLDRGELSQQEAELRVDEIDPDGSHLATLADRSLASR